MKAIVLAVCLALFACAAPHKPSETVCYLDDSTTPEVAQAAIDGAQAWSDATGGEFRCVAWVYGARVGDTDGTILVRVADTHPASGWHRLAETEGTNGHIDAVITIEPATLSGSYDLRTVLTHELGHAATLQHDDSGPGLMRTLYEDQSTAPTERDVASFRRVWE